MNKVITPRIWTIASVGIAVVAGMGLLLVFLARGPGEPAPIITPLPLPQSNEPIVASVDGRAIHYSDWVEAVLLDQVLSGLSGQPAPTSDETLQRLINEELVLQAIPPEQEPTSEQIEAQITTLEQTWGVNDKEVVATLEGTKLTRAAFERAIRRLLAVQAGLETLREQGHDSNNWMAEQRADAEIQIFARVAVLPPTPTIQSPLPTAPASPLPTPTTEAPSPTPALALPQVAPDFTLERAGGGMLTLTEQLAQGPVVLVFFQKCG